MFRNPINVFPYANAVDLTANGNSSVFNFTFQGDILKQWCVEIKDLDTNNVYYTSPIQNSQTFYNGDICSITITAGTASTSFTPTNTTNFSWSIYLSDKTTALTTQTIKTDSNTYQSNEFNFINSDTPELANTTINGVTINDGGSATITDRTLTYSATYATNSTNTSLKFYNVTIIDSNGNEILKTNNRYTNNISFVYGGLETGITYT